MGYSIDDPRPIAAEASYTFFLPSDARLAALAPGDMVQLIFRAVPPSEEWDAERMWAIVEKIEGDTLHGLLKSEPCDIASLKMDALISFRRWQVISIIPSEDRAAEPEEAHPRDYWDRCLVDRCLYQEGLLVHFLYRETPQPLCEEDRYPDSGWRIRADYRDVTDHELEAGEVDFIALGKVLNVDDSWLHLIDEPVGSAFIRNWETGEFLPYSD